MKSFPQVLVAPKSCHESETDQIAQFKHKIPVVRPEKCEGGWSNIKSLKNTSSINHVCAPFMTSCTTKKMSQQSLNICTEILGLETENISIIPYNFNALKTNQEPLLPLNDPCDKLWATRVVPGVHATRERDIPPPLRSLSEGNTFKVKRCVENGMYVLKATILTSPFRMTRTIESEDGHPRLCIRSFSNSLSYEESQKCHHLFPQHEDGVEEESYKTCFDEKADEYHNYDVCMEMSGCKAEDEVVMAATISINHRHHRAIKCC